ncbi:MAG TPA: ABC transporter permease subunit [Clostridiales bacterium]|nr:ABC transporter permease subunit [Clostridiales bacterium]
MQNTNTVASLDTKLDANAIIKPIKKGNNVWKKVIKNYELYIFILPALLYFLIFHYGPMYGIQIAFKDFIATKGIWGSPWTGMKHFNYFFKSYYFNLLIKNTVGIALYSMAAGFPIPIILALLLNELKNEKFKKLVQNVTYAPHFISTVVMVGMILAFLAPSNGIINGIIKALGGEPIPFMSKPSMFRSIYVWTGVWQSAGWSSIIYLAALSGIDTQLHEAAIVDGATRLQRIRHINIPGIMPTMVIILILNSGSIMNVGFEKVFLMQNSLNMETSDVISTYVYRMGLLNAQYSFSSAVGFFNSVINFTLLIIVNNIAKKLNETSLW